MKITRKSLLELSSRFFSLTPELLLLQRYLPTTLSAPTIVPTMEQCSMCFTNIFPLSYNIVQINSFTAIVLIAVRVFG